MNDAFGITNNLEVQKLLIHLCNSNQEHIISTTRNCEELSRFGIEKLKSPLPDFGKYKTIFFRKHKSKQYRLYNYLNKV